MLNGFIGEFLILLGTFRAAPLIGFLATSGVVLAAVVMLWMFRRVMFGPLENEENRKLIDLSLREKLVLLAVAIPIVWIGVHPDTFLRRIEPSVSRLVEDVRVRSGAEVALVEDGP
jgi:NADH-quinone oxidoreductase subunit M